MKEIKRMGTGLKIIGIATRTTHKNNQYKDDIPKLWERFFSENIIERIPSKKSSEIISLYTDYKSDFADEYTTIIGMAVNSLEEIPEGLTGREFKPEHFQKFIAKGEMPKAVIDVWSHIWEHDQYLNRKYSYDFEIYDERSRNGENSEVEIYISIK